LERTFTSQAAGLAVTNVDPSEGAWQFATDGVTWTDFGPASPAMARLLLGDADTRIRFRPNEDFAGLSSIQFRAWAGGGVAEEGGVADTFAGGGAAFGGDFFHASITVAEVND